MAQFLWASPPSLSGESRLDHSFLGMLRFDSWGGYPLVGGIIGGFGMAVLSLLLIISSAFGFASGRVLSLGGSLLSLPVGVINLDRGKSWYPHSWRARCLDRGQDRTLGGVGIERPDVSLVFLWNH